MGSNAVKEDIENTITDEISEAKTNADGPRFIDSLLCKQFCIKGLKFEMVDLLFVIALWILAYLSRTKLFPIVSGDFVSYNEWMQKISDEGVFSVIGNYGTSQIYMMGLVVAVTDNWLSGLKVLSIFFEYATSIAAFLILLHMTGSTRKSVMGMAFVLLSPTYILNGAYWGQCDAIYTCFIIWGIYYLLKDKGNLSMIMMGIALSFKLQAIFIFPFLIIIWLKKYTLKLLHFIWIPIVYFATSLPALFAGCSISDIFFAYTDQTSQFPWGTLEYPNLYAFLDENINGGHHMDEVSGAGLFLAIIVLGIICYYIYVKKIDITEKILILIALLTVAVTIYTLPHMHDRYGVILDMIVVIYAVINPKRIPLMIGFFLITVFTYMPFLTGAHIFSIQVLAVFETILIGIVGYDLYKEISNSESSF